MERNMPRGYLIGKSCWYIKVLVLALAIFSPASNAAWLDISPTIGNVTDFALAPSNPAIVLATTATGGNQGIWTSANSGATWSQQVFNRSYHGAAVKADNFNFMLAGVSSEVVEVSANGGVTWASTAGSASHNSWIIEFSPSSVNTVYAAGYTNGAPDIGILQKSTNAGNNWGSFSIGGDANPPTFSLAVAPTDANTVYVGAQPSGASNDGLYKTVNGATNWSYLSALNLTLVNALAVDPVDSDYVYAGTAGSGLIRRSSDGGASWTILHDPSNGGVGGFTSVRGLAINPADRRIIYAVGGSGSTKVIASTDCGVSWANVDAAGLSNGSPDKVVIDPTNGLVMVRTSTNFMYGEALLTTGIGACDPSTGFPSSGGGSSGAFDYLLMGMLMLIGVVRYRRNLGLSRR
jgi:hypothetical protein